MNWKRVLSMLAAAICALGAEAAQYHVTTRQTYTGIWSLRPGSGLIYHIDPGGEIVVNKSNGNCYIEVCYTGNAGTPCGLWLEGGTIRSDVLALRGSGNNKSYSTYRQLSGTLNMAADGGIFFDGGIVEMSGGVCNGPVNFRNCAFAEFTMSGGMLNAPSFGGANMDKADITFAVVDAYAVTGDYRTSNRYAIKATTPITQAPKSLTITGTPVSGCAYGLVDGITNDTFFTQTTVRVPAGWELARRGGKLLLIESAPLAVKTATWTGAAGDGNPRTPGNWICYAGDGTVIANSLPGFDTTVLVPAETTNFTFPADRAIVFGELRFQGDQYIVPSETDWRGLDFSLVTRAPATIDLNGQVLKVSGEPSATPQPVDLTQPGGTMRATYYGNSTQQAGSPAQLVDNQAVNTSRLLSGNFQGCALDYDFGAGKETVVRGVRFYCPSGPRRPKALTISGTNADPATATDADWNLLYTGSNLNLKSGGWTDYLTFDNDTPYRAYRIKVTANMGSDEYGNYLEFYEMEFVREARQPATEVTTEVAGGELRFDIPADLYKEIAKTKLSGALKVVKEGEGTLGFKKTNQSFTGGVDTLAGILRTQGAPGEWIFGGAATQNQTATTVTLHEDTMLDLWAYQAWGFTTLVLDGGTVTGRSPLFNPKLRLTAPSTIRATGDLLVSPGADLSDLGGQTLTLQISGGTCTAFKQSSISNGVIDVVSGGWFENAVALDARTVDLKMSAAMRLTAPLAVHDYVARRDSNYNEGDAELAVYGTFVPVTDFFWGCTMQDGSAIDLSARTNEWSIVSAFTVGRNVVSFADGASVTIALGARRPVRGERIVCWHVAPTNLETLSFAFSFDDETMTAEPALVTPTGIFYGNEPSVVDRAYWTGAIDDDVTKPGNWACTNIVNEGVVGAVPGTITTIHLAGDCAMNVPAESDLAYWWVICDAPLALTADCDWRGLDLNLIQDGAVIDLRGHKLFVSGFAGTTVRTLTITDSTTGAPGEFHVEVPEAAPFYVSTIAIDGNVRLVKEGAGTFLMSRAHQAYRGGTEIVAGVLRSEVDVIDWPFGGDGILDPSAMTITVRKGGQLYLAGKQHWANATVVLAGGVVQGQTADFNPTIVVTEDSQISPKSGNLTISPTAQFCDLGGKTLSVAIESGRGFYLNQSQLENGTFDILSGGWFGVKAVLDARTVNLKVGCALDISADLTVRDYESKYGANYNAGTNVMTVCGTFTPLTDFFYGCTLANGATIDLSSKTNAWSTTSAFTSSRKTVDFEPSARVGVKLGERKLEDGDQVIAWTEETAPENARQLKFKLLEGGGTLYVEDDGVYFRASGLVIFVR